MAKRKAKPKVIRHGKLRSTCIFCGKAHTESKHTMHGKDSFITVRSVKSFIRAQNKSKKRRR